VLGKAIAPLYDFLLSKLEKIYRKIKIFPLSYRYTIWFFNQKHKYLNKKGAANNEI